MLKIRVGRYLTYIKMIKQRSRWMSYNFVVLMVMFVILYAFMSSMDPPSNIIFEFPILRRNNEEQPVSFRIEDVMSGEPMQLKQDDPRIIKYIWDSALLEPPSKLRYNLNSTIIDPSMGQGQLIRKLFQNMKGGFFVECGALNGETRSNSLYMERELGWKGLLVEGDPINYRLMKEKHRKAWISNTCLAVKPYPHHARFMQSFNLGKILDPANPDESNGRGVVVVQCIPLYTLLLALNVTTVDYFSLDVEGSELQVLKTIPFDKVFIKTLSVEFSHTVEGKYELLTYMRLKGYVKVGEIRHPGHLANDFMFVHHSLPKLISISRLQTFTPSL